ncbi:MAG: alcohol dehydrogenase catalytic domain-containing protein [Gemmatimonadota bacterium]
MRALVFRGVEEVAWEEVPDPRILDPGDVVVEVAAAGLCGSDLHPYFGREEGLDAGTVLGHEFTGVVVEAGPAVTRWSAGDRVVAPFTTSCGVCAPCGNGLTSRCVRGQLFGWVEGGVGLHGGQATLVGVPEALRDDALALLAGDILSTALYGAELARIRPGDEVAVVGCGPVGLLAVRAALRAGAARVWAVDPVPGRRETAERFGARALDPSEAGPRGGEDHPVAGSASPLGRFDAVIEAAGTPQATRLAASLLRPGGRLGAVAVHTEPRLALSPGALYDRNLAYAAGRCPARRLLPAALRMAEEESDLLATLVSHRLPLERGPEAYRRFGAREAGWHKVVYTP